MAFRLTGRPGGSIADLREDSSTVRYDLDMLVETVELFRKAESCGDTIGKNAAIESFAVHARALIAFLFGHLEEIPAADEPERFVGRGRPNDVFAWDYFNGWLTDCPPPVELLGNAKRQADKHVAHIVTQRRGMNQPGSKDESVWELTDIRDESCRVMARFLTNAPPNHFEPVELAKMRSRLSPWAESAASSKPTAPVIAKSGPLDDPSPLPGLHAKTDARTTSLPPGVYPYGTTD